MTDAGVDLAGRTWRTVADDALLIVPVGSTEQHGPHLPLDTDTRIAVALARAAVSAIPIALCAPALAYGSSGEHAGFPGTLSIGAEALELVLVELVRSADRFRGVVLVNGHGGNVPVLSRVSRRCEAEGRAVLVWSPSLDSLDPPRRVADAHAGWFETSLMLHLAPGDVDMDAAEAGNTDPLPAIFERLVRDGVHNVSPNGVLGDPSGASAHDGRVMFEALTAALIQAVTVWMGGLRPGPSVS
ncbi:MAG: mycofactocin biosynthesis peptidyl-dipeptidase MftE [Acidimicrobiia bacterium]